MRIAICDDEKIEVNLLKTEIAALFEEPDMPVIDVFISGEQLLEKVMEKNYYDLIFLDILMTDLSGIEVAERLRTLCPRTQFVFVTNSRNYAVEAFSVRALNYLVKPITKDQVKDSFDRYDSRSFKAYIEVKLGKDFVKIYLENIFVLESSHNHTIIKTDGGEIRVNIAMRELEGKLDDSFIKLSRGVTVNMQYISEMKKDSCVLEDGRTVLLSRAKRNEIRSQYNNYIFNQVKRLPEWRG